MARITPYPALVCAICHATKTTKRTLISTYSVWQRRNWVNKNAADWEVLSLYTNQMGHLSGTCPGCLARIAGKPTEYASELAQQLAFKL